MSPDRLRRSTNLASPKMLAMKDLRTIAKLGYLHHRIRWPERVEAMTFGQSAIIANSTGRCRSK